MITIQEEVHNLMAQRTMEAKNTEVILSGKFSDELKVESNCGSLSIK